MKVTIEMDPELWSRLRQLVEHRSQIEYRRVSLSELARLAIADYLRRSAVFLQRGESESAALGQVDPTTDFPCPVIRDGTVIGWLDNDPDVADRIVWRY